MTSRSYAYACLTLAMLTVGSTVVASRFIAAGLPPFTATALRFAIALPIFLLLMRWRGTPTPRPSRRDAALLALQALSGSVGYTVLLISGLRHADAADAGVIAGSLPAISALVAVLLLGERPSRALLAAIAFATLGVAAIHLGPADGGRHSLLGNALVFAAVLCESLFILLNKQLREPVPPLTLSACMCGFGLLFTLVPALLERPWASTMDSAALWAVLYYALVPTIGGFILWYAGAERVTAAEASLFTALVPVSAVALAALCLGEAIALRQIVGVGCVLAAVGATAAASPRPSR
jgi:drug/metabolite transporter (DMT)-like permease